MGMFDSVYVKCPNCDRLVEFQSKAGDCCLQKFNENEVPIAIAENIKGKHETCKYCGYVIKAITPYLTETTLVKGI